MATKITRGLFGTTRAFHVVTLGLGLETLEQLAEMSAKDVRSQPHCGARTIRDLRDTLARHGLEFSEQKLLSLEPIRQPSGPEYFDMLRVLQVIAEFPLIGPRSPDSPAVYMQTVARHVLHAGKES